MPGQPRRVHQHVREPVKQHVGCLFQVDSAARTAVALAAAVAVGDDRVQEIEQTAGFVVGLHPRQLVVQMIKGAARFVARQRPA